MTNFIEEEKRIIKENTYNDYMIPRNVIDFSTFTTISSIFLVSDPMKHPISNLMFASLMSITGVRCILDILKSETERKWDIKDELSKMLSKTETYERLNKLYYEYVFSVIKLFESFDLKRSYDICNMYTILLNNGIFSMTGSNKKKNYKFIKGDLPELRGAKVLTGNVMGYESSDLLANILTNMGYSACILSVKTNNHLLPYRLGVNSPFARLDVFTGITEENGSYVYDQEKGNFLLSTSKSDMILKSRHQYHYVEDDQDEQNIHLAEGLFDYIESDQKIMTVLDGNITKINNIFLDNKSAFMTFRMKNLKLMQEIINLSEQLTPRSDQKILQWSAE